MRREVGGFQIRDFCGVGAGRLGDFERGRGQTRLRSKFKFKFKSKEQERPSRVESFRCFELRA
jgi:hypothetical protein